MLLDMVMVRMEIDADRTLLINKSKDTQNLEEENHKLSNCRC